MSPSAISKILTALACLVMVSLQLSDFAQAKLIRPQRYFDDNYDGMAYAGSHLMGSGGAFRTGERALVTVRGARDTYNGLPPRSLALESAPYQGAYPRRGIYDRLDGYGRGGYMSDLVPIGMGGG